MRRVFAARVRYAWWGLFALSCATTHQARAYETRSTCSVVISQLDRDGDERISVEEWNAAPLAWFDAADTNRDGTVTTSERDAVYHRAAEQRFAAHDRDGDGRLSYGELSDVSLRTYWWLDTNADGIVERPEAVTRWQRALRRDPYAKRDQTRASLVTELAREQAHLDANHDGFVDERELAMARRSSCNFPP